MTAEFKRVIVAVLGMLFLASLLVVAYKEVKREHKPGERPKPVVAADSKECVDCHQKTSPGIVLQWQDSKHALRGIGCLTCHAADAKDVDAFEHHGVKIATIVSPLDCSKCHPTEFKQQAASRHAEAASFVGSADNFLGEVVEGGPTPTLGCEACHGPGSLHVQSGGFGLLRAAPAAGSARRPTRLHWRAPAPSRGVVSLAARRIAVSRSPPAAVIAKCGRIRRRGKRRSRSRV